MNDWTLYAVFGFIALVATVAAPVVLYIDKKREAEGDAGEDDSEDDA